MDNLTAQYQPSPSDGGYVLPQAVEFEEAVIGALLLEREAYEIVESILSVKDFYNPRHGIIYEAVLSLKKDNRPVDMLTVVEELKQMEKLEEVGGPIAIAELSSKVASAAHLDYHARVVKQKAMARHLAEFGQKVLSMALNETRDVSDSLESTEQMFTELTATAALGGEAVPMSIAVDMAIEYAAQLQRDRNEGIIHTVPTGLTVLDSKLSGGWRAPDLIVIGGRPGMGKTQFALLFAQAAGAVGKDCLFISIEMTMKQLVYRYLLENEGVDDVKLRTGQLTAEEWVMIDEKAKELRNLHIHVADHHTINQLTNIKSLARRQHRKGKLKLMIIDYLQQIEVGRDFGTRDQEIGYITKSLKNLAKELDIPIILLAQLNRPPKGQKIIPPQLSDLRESGNIEQDADIVIFPHRPTYYKENEKAPNYEEWINRGALIIGKHREGEKDAKVLFKHDSRFKNIYDDDTVSNQFPIKTNEELPF